jgi:trimethylamine--corrinoid protein Co-methyltransferase
MDMKYGVPRFGSAESILVATASSEIGKHYGLPTHAYLGTTDSKTEDSQGGFESGIGLALAALTGINVVSGPGMTTQLNCQSLEKLVIDNEICGLSLRLKRGIDLDDADIMVDLIAESTEHQNYLKSKYTMKRYRSELQMPSEVICRLGLEAWKEGGMKDSFVRARDEVDKLLEIPVCQSLSAEQLIALDSILRDALVKSS